MSHERKELRWLPAATQPEATRVACPNCDVFVVRRPVLEANAPSGVSLVLLACDACGAHAFENLSVGDYANDPPGGGAALAFYLQQGANMGGMATRLAALGRPRASRYLEIGCGFGLGLDIARRTLDWEVLGLDPSPFAAAGRDQLGLPIAPRYLLPEDPLADSFDVIHASEVLEHVADPRAMLRTLHGALRADGTLLLTTPAAEAITPSTSLGHLVPLLSAGWHTIIQTAASLTMLLRQAGFEPVTVQRSGAQLVAIAGRAAMASETSAPDQVYRRWLRAAAAAVPDTSDLGIGLLARLYRELSGAGMEAEASLAWGSLDDAVSRRYGRSLSSWVDFVGASDESLDGLMAREPLALAGVLLHRGWSIKQKGEQAEPYFVAAIAAARRLRTALQCIGADDGDAEEVAFAAEKELILLAAERGDAHVADRIDALAAAGGGHHARAAARDCFVILVNHGLLDDAARLRDVVSDARSALLRQDCPDHATASILFCAAAMELQLPSGQISEAVTLLAGLRAALLRDCAAGHPDVAAVLFWATVDAQALGCRLLGQDAASLLAEAEHQAEGVHGIPPRASP